MFNTDVRYPQLDVNFYQQFAFNPFGLNKIINELNNPSFIDAVTGLFKDNPYNYIVSLKAYPFDVLSLYGTVKVLDEKTLEIGGVKLDELGRVVTLKNIYSAIYLGEYYFNEYYGTQKFLNYAPFTKISLYVPYFGEVDLPVNEVMAHTISFYLSVDPFTGYGTFYVYNKDLDYVILSKDTKLSIDISLGGTSASENNKNLLLNGTAVIGGALLASSTSSFIGSQLINTPSTLGSLREKITRGSISDGFTSLTLDNKMYIIKEIPNVAITNISGYQYFKGKPLEQVKTLSSLTGYTEVGDIHLEDMGDFITSTERDEIENLLKTGVIL